MARSWRSRAPNASCSTSTLVPTSSTTRSTAESKWNDIMCMMLKARDPRLAGFAKLSVAEGAHRFYHGRGPTGSPLYDQSSTNYDPSKSRSSARCASVSRSSPASASSTNNLLSCEQKPHSAGARGLSEAGNVQRGHGHRGKLARSWGECWNAVIACTARLRRTGGAVSFGVNARDVGAAPVACLEY